MNKLYLILTVALATSFTLTTSCGEKTQTPEQLKMVAIKEGKEAMEKLNELGNQKGIYKPIPEETIDSLLEIVNKGRKETGEALIYTRKQAAAMGFDTSEAGRKKSSALEFIKASRNAGK